jgi:hypothetical protein
MKMAKTKKSEIKKAWILSQSPIVIGIRYKSGGADTYNLHQLYNELTDGARRYVWEMCDLEEVGYDKQI